MFDKRQTRPKRKDYSVRLTLLCARELSPQLLVPLPVSMRVQAFPDRKLWVLIKVTGTDKIGWAHGI